jgi:hypothetical protein
VFEAVFGQNTSALLQLDITASLYTIEAGQELIKMGVEMRF